jgi:tetratricopeptide (TPR) repeat protein
MSNLGNVLDALTSMNNLASALENQGWSAEAQAIQRQVLEIYKKILGCDHPYVVRSMGNLANALYSQARYDEAELMQR